MKRSRENLDKISEICSYLIDRDVNIKSEYFFIKSIIDSIPISFFILKIDNKLKITNQIGKNITNYKGKTLFEIFDNNDLFIADCYKTFSGNVIKSTTILDGKNFNFINYPIVSKDNNENCIITIAWD